MNNRKLTEIVGSNDTSKKLELLSSPGSVWEKEEQEHKKDLHLRKQAEKLKQLCIQDYNKIKTTR